ncbi:MAG TPA: YCF48-related protein [Ignavibacteriaceae bacterium]|nr:YCF48-related protein [Ignavibacteriaceae bacterium]
MKRLILLFVLLFYGILSAQEGWFWQNPLPRGNEYSEVIYLNSGVGWIVGSYGLLLETIDEGLTWKVQPFDATTHLHSICFPNQNIGYIVGGEWFLDGGGWEITSILFKTLNGGNTWIKMPMNLGEFNGSFRKMFFLNADTGYLAGESIYKTTDGGENWTQILSNSNGLFYKIHFYGNYGMVIWENIDSPGTTLFRTTDAGNSWSTSEYYENDLTDVFLINENNAISISKFGKIYRTTNNGISWTKVYDNGTKRLSSITFFDQDNGFISSNSDGSILRTSNGGINWVSGNSNFAGLNDISYFNKNIATAVGNFGALFRTSDAGLNWTSQYNIVTQKNLNTLTFTDENNGFIIGDDNIILRTTNAGTNWLSNNISGTHKFEDVSFANNNYGIILDNSGNSIKTTNGGITWFAFDMPSNLKAIEYINSNTAIAVGSQGTIVKTMDGGLTWSPQNIGSNYNLVAISFSNSNYGIVIGNQEYNQNSKILRTSDGGTTWISSVYEGQSAGYLKAISFADQKNAMIVAPNIILKSSNSGINWIEVNPSIGSNWQWQDVSLVDDNYAFIAGALGKIIATTNGGIDWIVQRTAGLEWNLSAATVLNGIYATKQNNVTVVGNKGTILKFKDMLNLPVELSSFTASQSKNSVILNWQTATETNNKGFEVQRKSSSNEFISLAFVKGNGTITSPQSYSYSDNNISPVEYTYRLKQIDFDGTFEYSKEIEVKVNEIPKKFSLEQNYPNPFNPSTTIKFSVPEEQLVEVKIFDVLGNEVAKVVKENFSPGSYEREWDASKLSSGVYYLRMKAGDFSETKKMVLMK